MSTQYGEDLYILEHFAARAGRFLDVGAGDGLTWSNTKPLLDAGWSGVMVEPALSQLRWLIENHGENPRVEIIPGFLHPSMGWWHFFDSRDYSTANAIHRRKIEQHSEGVVAFRERRAPSLTWRGLLNDYPGPYQFLNIDVEGPNLAVLCAAPLEQFEMVCVEIDPESALPEMARVLAAAGLVTQKRIGGNLIAHA